MKTAMLCVIMCGVIVDGAQPSTTCPEIEQYLEARSANPLHDRVQADAFADEWLPRLLMVRADPGCGTGLVSARFHAMTLANLTEQWGLAHALATEGALAATNVAEQAVWRMNAAGALYHAINPNHPGTIHAAIEAIDWFLSVAPGMDSATQPPGAQPVSAIPTVNALVWRAQCQRLLGDHLGAASTEQRVATVFFALRVDPETSLGGFLPEEAYARAAVDYANADRPSDAAGCITAIRLMPGTARPSGQHAWNAISAIADARRACRFVHHLLQQAPIDRWAILAVYETAVLTRASRCDDNLCREATGFVNQILAGSDEEFNAAAEILGRMQAAAGRGPSEGQSDGLWAMLLRTRYELEFHMGDLPAARATLDELEARGRLGEFTARMRAILESRDRAERAR